MARRNWLQAQIRESDSDVQHWPEWMKKVATFDGSQRDDAIDPSTPLIPTKSTPHAFPINVVRWRIWLVWTVILTLLCCVVWGWLLFKLIVAMIDSSIAPFVPYVSR